MAVGRSQDSRRERDSAETQESAEEAADEYGGEAR
jgi:hypothetical protein